METGIADESFPKGIMFGMNPARLYLNAYIYYWAYPIT